VSLNHNHYLQVQLVLKLRTSLPSRLKPTSKEQFRSRARARTVADLPTPGGPESTIILCRLSVRDSVSTLHTVLTFFLCIASSPLKTLKHRGYNDITERDTVQGQCRGTFSKTFWHLIKVQANPLKKPSNF
jgi:hypothetical protein